MRRGLVLLVAVCLAGVLVMVAPPVAAIAGGRIQFIDPVRVEDTRINPALRSTTFTLPSGSILQLWILPGIGHSGTAVVHPCSIAAPPDTASFVYSNGGVVYGRFVTSAVEPTCLTATTVIDLVVDVVGNVSATPQLGRVQYVAIDPPAVVHDGAVVTAATSLALSRGPLPPDATGVALLLDVLNPATSGFAVVHGCSRPRSMSADIGFAQGRSTSIAYVSLDPGEVPCIYSSATESFRVTIVGYFTADGPNPSTLPPTIRYTASSVPPPGLRPITPVRVLDTRIGLGRSGVSKVDAGQAVELNLAGRVDATATAVVLNVTATEPEAPGFATAYPCDQTRPTASNINYVTDQTVPNLVTVRISLDRRVCIYTQSRTHLIADLSGTFVPDSGSRGHPVTPARLLDTRDGLGVASPGIVHAGDVVTLQVAGRGGVPATTADAATLNVTVTEPAANSFVTVWPCDQQRPVVSNLNFVAGETVPNLVTVKLSADGTVCLYSPVTTHLIADLAMWYAGGETIGFHDLAPQRVLDTRDGNGVAVAGKSAALNVVHLTVADRAGVPATGVSAIALNVTVTEPAATGFVTVWPCDRDMPVVSNLNFVAGETVPNAVNVAVAADGTVCLLSTATTHLIADIAGYFTATPVTGALAPSLT